jgi:dimethylargininase
VFKHAIVRKPAENFAGGLTTATLGRPDYPEALAQHEAYCQALVRCGLALTELDPDPRFPDSTFVEDTAVLIAGGAILTRPGAPSREGEVRSVEATLAEFFPSPQAIVSPGTLDGGDICEAEGTIFIGISERTNPEGAEQLAGLLALQGLRPVLVDIRGIGSLLHLKSGLAYLGEGRLAAISALSGREAFRDHEVVVVPPGEEYAANCVRVNDHLLVASGFTGTAAILARLGYSILPLDMSEFQKMDGGLSCLSLRF